jgi:hypothetical protein
MHSHEHARQRFRFLMGIFDKSARERDGRDASGANTKLVSFLFSLLLSAKLLKTKAISKVNPIHTPFERKRLIFISHRAGGIQNLRFGYQFWHALLQRKQK